MRSARFLLVAPLLLLVAGCGTTLRSTWTEPTAVGKPLRHVLVVGMAEQEVHRRLFEDTFSQRLLAQGVSAQQSYQLLPVDQEPTRENLKAAVAGTDIESMFVSRFVRTDREEVYREPFDSYGGPGGYYFDRHYDWYYGRVTSPGYWSENTYVILENNLYDVASGKLIWSAESESFNPDSGEEIVRELSETVIADLRNKRLLP